MRFPFFGRVPAAVRMKRSEAAKQQPSPRALLLPETRIAGFRPCFDSTAPQGQENAKTRVDERSTRDLAFYLSFGRAGPCRGENPG